jgi:Methyltransferase domain
MANPPFSGILLATVGIFGAMACAGYLEYDPSSHRFTLPPEHIPVLAQEGGPVFLGGVQEEMVGVAGPVNQLMQAFRNGGGVPMEAYDPSAWEGVSRFTSGWFENLLVPVWLPAMPEVQAKLERGALVADVGCGQGKASIKLAQTYPQSRYVGYDNFAPSIEQAKANRLPPLWLQRAILYDELARPSR